MAVKILHNKVKFAWYGVAVITTLLMCASVAFSATKSSDKDKKVVRDLDYGVSLFYFYQGEYFEAARSLLVAQELGRLANQKEDADLLLGGIYLQYGLHLPREPCPRASRGRPRRLRSRSRPRAGGRRP